MELGWLGEDPETGLERGVLGDRKVGTRAWVERELALLPVPLMALLVWVSVTSFDALTLPLDTA